ncbi:MAG: Gfo/Idh/MocA family oxidoreductase [Anaerolineae bacterium]|nr:Gfo/Idh/MocA family oxidoreductase [Anaerolineae bacterium]
MSKRIKLGIVGCGFAGTQTMYAPILRHLQQAEVTALTDPDPNALAFMTERYGQFDCYTDFDSFLANAPVDAVLLATPVFLHEPQAIQAARAGKHILCEKPMAPTIEACDAMIAAAQANTITLMVGFSRRFDKSVQLAHSLLQEGRLGRLVHIRAEVTWCHDLSPLGHNWRQSIRTLGGLFQDNATHIIDLCAWWAGPIETVSAQVRRVRADWQVETHAHATLGHTSGVISTIHTSNISHKPTVESFLLEGTDAALELSFGPAAKYASPEPFTVYLWEKGVHRRELTLGNFGNIDRELGEHSMYRRSIDEFALAIQERRSPWIDGFAGRAAIEVVNAAYLSAAHNETIRLPLVSSGDLKSIFEKMPLFTTEA